MNPIPDISDRSQALDPLQSFCVTAPAGSGKTELLIQRYLKLLERVQQPEQILAITFTRKAAAEMRQRILSALDRAADPEPPGSAHGLLTWTLARKALEANQRLQWSLPNNPSRLNIKTIDSYCASLARQLPILSGFGGAVTVADDPEPLYRLATRSLLDSLERNSAGSGELSELLLLYDNNWALLEDLLVRLLSRRDQWLAYMGTGLEPVPASEALTRTAVAVIEDALGELAQALDDELLQDLWTLLGYACDNLGRAFPPWPMRPQQEHLSAWKALVDMLLTGGNSWRVALSKTMGFPTDSGQGRAAASSMKDRLTSLIGSLSAREGLLPLLLEVRMLPLFSAQDADWRRVIGLSRLLPGLVARLVVEFQLQGEVDYPQVSLAAREALGEDDNPTDLALKLDYSLQHILLDEFQDTSISQFELVRRLTREWLDSNHGDPDNPKTFFVVGDGMQSIYGFRDADVSLFIHARDYGFNGLLPRALTLSSNFRSDPVLVDWVNRSFSTAFPREDNELRGEISFSPATPVLENAAEARVDLRAFIGEKASARHSEAEAVAEVVADAVADDDCKAIAILVRTRSQLVDIVDSLKARRIEWQAEDIDPLAESVVVSDLMNLCQALHHFGDRVAWLALLRAPWCGLRLEDLLALVKTDRDSSLWKLLNNPDCIGTLEPDARNRVARLVRVLQASLAMRGRLGLRQWIEWSWETLGGASSVNNVAELEDAEAFFALLESMDNRGESFSGPALYESVQKLFSHSSSATSKVHLMTLHKSKGLEFDRVIIPGLSRTTRADGRELLLWGQFHNLQETGFLLAADDPLGRDESSLYNFLQYRNRLKGEQESIRLLYVGVTRAIRQLYLFTTLEEDEGEAGYRNPAAQSLLSCLWPGFAGQMQKIAAATDTLPHSSDSVQLRRLARMPQLPAWVEETVTKATPDPNIPVMADNRLQRATGTVVHSALQRLSQLPEDSLSEIDPATWSPWIDAQLRALFVSESDLPSGREEVLQSLYRVLDDQTGRWLLAANREQAVSEYALSSLREDGRLLEMIVDRAFVADGVRWVVDYKSSRPDPGEKLPAFLLREEQRYRAQLENYRLAFAQRESISVKTALYFTALPYWHEFDSQSVPR